MKYSWMSHKNRNRHKNEIKMEWASSVGLCQTQTVTPPPREDEPLGRPPREGSERTWAFPSHHFKPNWTELIHTSGHNSKECVGSERCISPTAHAMSIDCWWSWLVRSVTVEECGAASAESFPGSNNDDWQVFVGAFSFVTVETLVKLRVFENEHYFLK